MAELANAQAVDQLLELVHPEIEVLSVPGFTPGPGYFGHADLRRYFDDATARGAHAQVEIDRLEITPAGNVFAEGQLSTSADGITEALPAWFVYRFRDELLSAVQTYLDRQCAWEHALAHAAASPSNRSPESPGMRQPEPGRV
jgi:hypothetical protein